ncbi:hypothetical protein MHA_0130 [Mannheimia haemolytica PHL213]|nr:hypothetical protein MHH_c25250 [Mannheimia haemolytica M42548]EDN73120.1 hypothetical protein MHA_0130 [Mannheimia haemolytica PHL213]
MGATDRLIKLIYLIFRATSQNEKTTSGHFSTFFAKNRRKMTACQKKLII